MNFGELGLSPSACRSSEITCVSALSVTITSGQSRSKMPSFVNSTPGSFTSSNKSMARQLDRAGRAGQLIRPLIEDERPIASAP